MNPSRAQGLGVLLVEDQPDDAELVLLELRRAGYAPVARRVQTEADFLSALEAGSAPGRGWDLILADYQMPGFTGLRALQLLRGRGLDVPFILISGTIGEDAAVEAIRLGAADYLMKDRLGRLGLAIQRVLEEHDLDQAKRQAEQALRDSEQRFRALIENSTDGIGLVGPDGKVSYVSPAVTRMLGYSATEIIGRDPFEMVHPDDQTQVRETINWMLRRPGQTGQTEYRLRHASGAWRAIRTSVTNLLAEPSVQAMVFNYRDITADQQAEQALRASEARYRSLFENSPISLWEEDFSAVKQRLEALVSGGITDLGEYLGRHPEVVAECARLVRVIDVNNSALKLLGASNKAQLTRGLLEVIEPEANAVFRDQLISIAQGQTDYHCVTTNRTLNGEKLYLSLNWSAVQGYEQTLGRVIISTIDMTQRERAETELQQRLSQSNALRAIDVAITASLDLDLTLRVLLDQVVEQLRVDAADLLLLEPATQTLRYAAGRGFRSAAVQQARVRLGEGRAGQAALERRTVVSEVGDAQPAAKRTGLLGGDHFVSYYGVPLIAKGQLLGVLEIFHRSPLRAGPDWLDFLQALAGQAAIALDNAALFNGLQRSNSELQLAYDATIRGWSRALDLRDRETEGHGQRVTDLTERLALALGVNPADLVAIHRGALLHDIGKMGVPDHILFKPGPLSDDEWAVMRRHPALAYEMLSPISYLKPALDIPYCHHEKWDGSGYPRQLKGEAIPLAARIFAVVDVWDALSSDRPYRPRWPAEQVLGYLRDQAGKHFDPAVVAAFLVMPGPALRPGSE